MPYFRARVHDGKTESVVEEKFKDEASLREQLPRRGWVTILGVEEIPGPAAAPTPTEAQAPPIRADQIRDAGAWTYLWQELAERHPLHGIGGWTGLLLAQLVVGTTLGVFALATFVVIVGRDSVIDVMLSPVPLLFGALIIVEALQIACLVLLLMRSRAFPVCFTIFAVWSAAFVVLANLLLGPDVRSIASLITVLGWTVYIVVSVRVNVTFRRRVERDDDWLNKGLAAADAPAPAR